MKLFNSLFVFSGIFSLCVSLINCDPEEKKPSSDGKKEDLITVITTGGEIVGKRVKVDVKGVNNNDNLYVTRFYGIPFAEPPIGNLRFKPPVKASPWVGKRNAFSFEKSCVQPVLESAKEQFNVSLSAISEDCLYLNAWIPDPVPKSAAVMVYIYGGAFAFGSTELYDFSTFSATQEIIVVSMNYRVSSLGFLYFGNDNCPGNMGLMDQDLALRWVHENIDRFGGDPSRVTIIGPSAGSVSTGHHLLNPNSEKLFQRAILQSGSPIGSWGRDSLSQGLMKSMKLAEMVGCANNSKISKTIECLRNVDSLKLVSESAKLGDIIAMYHFPVVDNKFVYDVAAATGSLLNKEVLLGVTSDEGGIFTWLFLLLKRATTENLFETFANMYLGTVNSQTLRSVKYYYKDHCNEVTKYKEETATLHAATDFLFICDTKKLAEILTNAGVKTFLYRFTYKPSNDNSPAWVGADHGSDAFFVIGTPNFQGAELELSQRIMTYWSSFAKHGDPNEEPQTKNVNFHFDKAITAQKVLEPWPRYTLSEKGRLDIGLYYSRKETTISEKTIAITGVTIFL